MNECFKMKWLSHDFSYNDECFEGQTIQRNARLRKLFEIPKKCNFFKSFH